MTTDRASKAEDAASKICRKRNRARRKRALTEPFSDAVSLAEAYLQTTNRAFSGPIPKEDFLKVCAAAYECAEEHRQSRESAKSDMLSEFYIAEGSSEGGEE